MKYFDSIKAAASILKMSGKLNIDLNNKIYSALLPDKKPELILNLIWGLDILKKKGLVEPDGDKLFLFTSACYYLIKDFSTKNEDYFDRAIMMTKENEISQENLTTYFKMDLMSVFSFSDANVYQFDDSPNPLLNIDIPELKPTAFTEPIAIHLNYLRSKRRAITIPDYHDFAFYFVILFLELFANKFPYRPNKTLVDKLIDSISKSIVSFNIFISQDVITKMVYKNIKNEYVSNLKDQYLNYLYDENNNE